VSLRAAEEFPLTPDSKAQEGVPKGEVLKFTFDKSQIFPGTTREYWIYVPKQYDPAKPACVYVNQDGIQWNAPVVFDNLIHKAEMPITIGVFVRPGVVPAVHENALPRFNRSFEYDGLGDNHARFLLEELLPEVEKQKTADGRAIVLSKNGNDRAIGGSSSGGIAAFTAAWERPDAFSRVFSAIGTYVGLRGGHEYPTLIRKVEPKPLRIFLQGGSNDLNNYTGDWWMANQEMQRALTFAGYEVNHAWGSGAHNGAHGTQVFPDAMRYLWKDWPQPIKAGLGSPQLKDILIPGEGWIKVLKGSDGGVQQLALNEKGEVFYSIGNRLIQVGVGQMKVSKHDRVANHDILAFGSKGQSYRSGSMAMNLVTEDARGTLTFVNEIHGATGLVALSNGSLYICHRGNNDRQITHITPDGKRRVVALLGSIVGRLTVSPDQTLLYLSGARSQWIWSYQIQPDGSLQHGQKFHYLHVPDTNQSAGASGMCVDRDGRLYVATAMGIQVCDQAGKATGIIPVPGGEVSAIALGGADFNTLYATTERGVFQRKVKTKGAPSFLPPVKPAPPRL
jgi:enterochelin esterase-like enzyme